MRTIKEPLKKVLGKALLNFEEMTTILAEVEIVVNNRPLTYVSSSADEPDTLTPSHFLIPGKRVEYPLHFLEHLAGESTKENLTRRKRYQTLLVMQIWSKWKNEYLLHLKTAHSLQTPTPKKELKVKEFVLLEGCVKNKLLWDIGVVEEVFRGRDGNIRSCLVRTATGKFKRPIQLIYPLELDV